MTKRPLTNDGLAQRWAQDLSTCTEEEIRERWSYPGRSRIDKIDPLGFEGRLLSHNPIYFLAQKVFFNNVLDRPEFLYAPFHRDVLCKAALMWLTNADPFILDIPEEFNGLITGTLEVTDTSGKAGLLFMAPRDTYKSTFFHGAVPLWYALRMKHLQDRDARIAIPHQKDVLSFKNLRRLRFKSTKNQWLKDTWPGFAGSTLREIGSNKGLVFPYLLQGGGGQAEYSIEAAGMGGSLTGGHYDMVDISDMVTEADRRSKTVRDETHNSFDALRYVSDTVVGKFIIDGTPYHPQDEYSRMERAKTDGEMNYISVICHATDCWPDDPKDAVPDTAKLLHPYRWSVKAINKRRMEEVNDPRGDGRDTFSRLQINCERRTSDLVATDPAWIKHIRADEIPEKAWMCLLIDPAWKGSHNAGEGDSASLQVWAYWTVGEILNMALVDGVHSNELTGEDGKRHSIRLMRKHYIYAVAPEQVTGWSWATSLEEACLAEGLGITLIKLKAVSSKVKKPDRIITFLGRMQAGCVYLSDGAPPDVIHAFTEQFLSFPQCMDDHDDALDCAAHTCDEEIIKNYAPSPRARKKTFYRRPPPLPPQFTRHSGV